MCFFDFVPDFFHVSSPILFTFLEKSNQVPLAIVVQGPATGGLDHRGSNNFVGLFAFEYPLTHIGSYYGPTSLYDFRKHIRVFSTWATKRPEELELIAAYEAAGFHIVESNLTDFLQQNVKGPLVPNAEGGRGTLNLQMQTSRAGLQRAKELGASHAMKIRSDTTITNFSAFLLSIGNNGIPHRLTFAIFSDYPHTPLWSGQHFVPSSHDTLFLGPINDVFDYSNAKMASAENYIYGELIQMESYMHRRNLTRLGFCQASDFLYPRLPDGNVIWHRSSGSNDVKVFGHSKCRTTCTSCDINCDDHDICPPYSFGTDRNGEACANNCV